MRRPSGRLGFERRNLSRLALVFRAQVSVIAYHASLIPRLWPSSSSEGRTPDKETRNSVLKTLARTKLCGAENLCPNGISMVRSRSKRISVFDHELVLVKLHRICGCQTGELLTRRVDHIEVTIRPVVPA